MTDSIKSTLRGLPSLAGPFPDGGVDALPDSPHEAFRAWLEDAIAAGIREPHAMTLSTVDENGWPDARVLLLKNLDERGWHFAIKDDGPKGRQIKATRHVALTFYWADLGRQIRLRGPAVSLSQTESAQDFLDRPLHSKISAVASRQSEVLASNEDFERSSAEAKVLLTSNPGFVARSWTVYAVDVQAAEFWQGASDRVHKRMQYLREPHLGTWRKQRLWP